MKLMLNLMLLIFTTSVFASEVSTASDMTIDENVIVMQTNMGDIVIALDEKSAPKTVANFKKYVKTGFYTNVVFHRVISNFMIQGGGFTQKMEKKVATFTVENESIGGLPNIRGSISMARTSDPHSASSQFFINVQDNPSLDSKGDSHFGYAVFGQVIEGMDVVDKIKLVKTQRYQPPYNGALMHNNSPIDLVVIEMIYVKGQKPEMIEPKEMNVEQGLEQSSDSGFVTLLFSLIAFIFISIRKAIMKCPKLFNCKNK